MAHFLRKSRHFSNAAGIVGYRTERIERNNHARKTYHRRHRNRRAEQARQLVGSENAAHDHHRRQRRRLKRDGQTLDDVRAMPRHRGLRDRHHRTLAGCRVVFRDPDDQTRHDKSDNTAPEQARARNFAIRNRTHHAPANMVCRDPEATNRKHTGCNQTLVQRAHDRVVRAKLDEERADDRGHDAGRTNGKRIQHRIQQAVLACEEDRRQNHRGNNRHRIGFEQIGRHARAIADIVTDIVRNRCRVAGVIFRNTGFDLTHEIGANVRALREDTAAETREDRDQRGTEAERDKRVNHDPVRCSMAHRAGQHPEINGDAEQCEARDEHAGHGTRLEGDIKTCSKRLRRGLRRPHIRAHRHIHADKACETRQDRTNRKPDGDRQLQEIRDDNKQHHADDRNRQILPLQISLRAFGNCRGDFLHARIARIATIHIGDCPCAVSQREQSAQYNQANRHCVVLTVWLPPEGPSGSRRGRNKTSLTELSAMVKSNRCLLMPKLWPRSKCDFRRVCSGSPHFLAPSKP